MVVFPAVPRLQIVMKSSRASFYCRGRPLPLLISPGSDQEWPGWRLPAADGEKRRDSHGWRGAANPLAHESRGTGWETKTTPRLGTFPELRRVESSPAGDVRVTPSRLGGLALGLDGSAASVLGVRT